MQGEIAEFRTGKRQGLERGGRGRYTLANEEGCMKTQQKPWNLNKVNLAVDSVLLLVFLVAMAPRFSGVAIHEWLSIGLGGVILLHLLLHWQWLVRVTRRFFGATPLYARVNYLLNLSLFICMTVVTLSGLMISIVALPLVGILPYDDGRWHSLHIQSANVAVVLVGLHLALHWQWVSDALRRYVRLSPLSKHTLPPKAEGTSPKEGV
jgi:hypothetical protein